MRKSQYQTPNGCQTSRGTTFVNCKPSQPVQLYALLAGLPTALCPGYQFFIFRLFRSFYLFHFIYLHVTHHSLLASSLRLHSSQSSHWFRSSAPTAQRLSFRPFLQSWLWPKQLQQSPTSAKPQWRFCRRELRPVAGSWKVVHHLQKHRDRPNQVESNGIKWNQSITKSLTNGVKCTIATQQVLQHQMLAFQCFSSCIICTKEPNDPPEAAARSDCSTWRKRHFIQRYIFVKLHTGPIPLCPSLSSAAPSMFAFSSSGFCRNFRLHFCGFASVQSCCFRSRLPCVIFISFVALQESV